jgi:hypothetical protein
MWRLNSLTPLWADDYCRLSNSTDIVRAAEGAYTTYLGWSGRFFVTFLNFMVLGNYPGSMTFFNILNAAFFCLLIFNIFYLSLGRIPKNLRDCLYVLLIFVLVFVGTRALGEVALWKTGSIGYLWGVTLELVFLIPFFSYARGQKLPSENKYLIWGFYFISFVASTFLEHLSIAVSAVALFICLRDYFQEKSSGLPKPLFISAALHIIGSLVLIMAKGNFVRSGIESLLPLNQRIINNFDFSIEGLGWVLITFWLMALINKSFITSLKKSTIWLSLALAALTIIAYCFIPAEMTFIRRVTFPFEIFFIIAIMHLVGFMPKVAIFEIGAFVVLLVLAFGHAMTAYRNTSYFNRAIKQRYEIIEAAKSRREYSVVVPPISWEHRDNPDWLVYVSKYNYITDISVDPSHWTNACFARALGVGSVAVEEAQSN